MNRSPFLGKIGAVAAAGVIGAAGVAGLIIGTIVTGGGTGASAAVWIDPAGANGAANCKRLSPPAPEPTPTSVCSTPQAALALAQPGDTIGVAAGLYTIGFSTSTTPLSNVTFSCAGFCAFEGEGTMTGGNLTLQGTQIGYGVGFSLGRMHITATSPITFNKVNSYCQTGPGTQWIQLHDSLSNQSGCNAVWDLGGSGGFTWNGGDIENQGSCFGSSCTYTNTSSLPEDWVIGGQNIVLNGITARYWWEMSAAGHSELFFLHGGSNITIKNSVFRDCVPPPSTGYPIGSSCNTSYIFVGQFAGTDVTTDFLSLINDTIETGTGLSVNNGTGRFGFAVGYNYPPGTEPHFTLAYDNMPDSISICGATSAGGCGAAKTTLTGVNEIYAGNVIASPSFGACFSAASYTGNTWYHPTGTAPKCGATDQRFSITAATTFWANPIAGDYTPLSPIWTSGESTYCLSLANPDQLGVSRPASGPCTAGPIQH